VARAPEVDSGEGGESEITTNETPQIHAETTKGEGSESETFRDTNTDDDADTTHTNVMTPNITIPHADSGMRRVLIFHFIEIHK
jgi:hypothetical protein